MSASLRLVACLLLLGALSYAQLTAPGSNLPPAGVPSKPAAGLLGWDTRAGDAAHSGVLPGPDSDLIINSDDVLDLYVMDVPELSRQYRVSPAGTVLLPLLDQPLPAAGTKVTAFADTVTRELREHGLVSHPHVIVSIASSRLMSVAITGAVKMPQIYPVFGRTTLLDVLSQAQGLTDDASMIAVISRGEIGARAANPAASPKARPELAEGARSVPGVETVDLKKALETGNPIYNVDIYPGDRITVPRAGIVYVVGAVNKPGVSHPLHRRGYDCVTSGGLGRRCKVYRDTQ